MFPGPLAGSHEQPPSPSRDAKKPKLHKTRRVPTVPRPKPRHAPTTIRHGRVLASVVRSERLCFQCYVAKLPHQFAAFDMSCVVLLGPTERCLRPDPRIRDEPSFSSAIQASAFRCSFAAVRAAELRGEAGPMHARPSVAPRCQFVLSGTADSAGQHSTAVAV